MTSGGKLKIFLLWSLTLGLAEDVAVELLDEAAAADNEEIPPPTHRDNVYEHVSDNDDEVYEHVSDNDDEVMHNREDTIHRILEDHLGMNPHLSTVNAFESLIQQHPIIASMDLGHVDLDALERGELVDIGGHMVNVGYLDWLHATQVVALDDVVPSTNTSDQEQDLRRMAYEQRRIYRGTKVENFERYPWMVSLVDVTHPTEDGHFCGGTLIDLDLDHGTPPAANDGECWLSIHSDLPSCHLFHVEGRFNPWYDVSYDANGVRGASCEHRVQRWQIVVWEQCYKHLGDRSYPGTEVTWIGSSAAQLKNPGIGAPPAANDGESRQKGSRWVLTAAHCFIREFESPEGYLYEPFVLEPQDLQIRYGSNNLSNGKLAKVQSYYIHESYIHRHSPYKELLQWHDDGGDITDIALIYLAEEVEYPGVKLAGPTIGGSFENGEKMEALGWGPSTLRSTTNTQDLQHGYQVYMEQATCQAENPEVAIGNDVMCVRGEPISTVLCKGDSGGPLFKEVDGEEIYQVGIASMTSVNLQDRGCGTHENPTSFFTRVAPFMDWIAKYTMSSNPPAHKTFELNYSVIEPEQQCFSLESIVETEFGGEKLMRELKVGENVKVNDGSFSTVVGYLDRDEDAPTAFLELLTANGSITLTREHLLMTDTGMMQAGDVKLGTRLVRESGVQDPVVEIKTKILSGFAAPLTKTGTIVVDGYKASNYASVTPSILWLVELVMWPRQQVVYDSSSGWDPYATFLKFVVPSWVYVHKGSLPKYDL